MIASLPSPSSGVLELGPLSLRAYGLCIAIGVIVAVSLSSRRYVRRGGPRGLVESIAWWAVPAGLVGARLYHVATDWRRFEGRWLDAVKIWQGGLGIWGGVGLGVAVGCFVAARKGARPIELMDVVAPALPLAQAIGRFGNWFNQELFGRPTSLPWGLEIDVDHRPIGFEADTTFHPTFLYEALWCVGVALGLMWLERRRPLKAGQLFCLYVAGYTLGRWWIEALRIDEATQVGGVRVNSLVAPVVLALALVAFGLLSRRPEEPRTYPAPVTLHGPAAAPPADEAQGEGPERDEPREHDEEAPGAAAATSDQDV